MGTVRLNRRCSYAMPLPNGQGELLLYPGVNLFVPEADIDALKSHPITKTLIEQSEIDILTRSKSPKSDIAGIPVIDGKDEPLPVMPVKDRSAAIAKPKS